MITRSDDGYGVIGLAPIGTAAFAVAVRGCTVHVHDRRQGRPSLMATSRRTHRPATFRRGLSTVYAPLLDVIRNTLPAARPLDGRLRGELTTRRAPLQFNP